MYGGEDPHVQITFVKLNGFLILQFKLIVENPKKPVASGLYITATVEYHPDNEEDLHDRLLLHVEKKIIEIPLIGYDIST